MVIAPEEHTRYWRSRSPYPRPFAGEANDGSSDDNTDESCSPLTHKIQRAETLLSREPSWRQRVDDWTLSCTPEHDLEFPLEKYVAWDPDYAPWNTNRRRASQSNTQTSVSCTTSSPDGLKWPSLSEGIDSDDSRGSCFSFTQPKPTAADHSRPPLYDAHNDPARKCCSLADSLKSPFLSMRALKEKQEALLSAQRLLEPRRPRVLPSPFSGLPVQPLADASTAFAPYRRPGSDSDSGRYLRGRGRDGESSADYSPWQRGGAGKPRETCLDAGTDPRMDAARKRAERMDQLAVWVVPGLVMVWVLLMIANLKLAGYEAALKSM
ncbi:hypothetical protein LZ31DRAFT_579571 [Colletotrichum somersetense]|nr:hypothetical protein LZ31DRAFT_579571 [Colletotrichum somersetense]